MQSVEASNIANAEKPADANWDAVMRPEVMAN